MKVQLLYLKAWSLILVVWSSATWLAWTFFQESFWRHLLFWICAFFVCAFAQNRARQWMQKARRIKYANSELALEDIDTQANPQRPTALYLRSFSQDGRVDQSRNLLNCFSAGTTVEESLVHSLPRYWDVIAVGDPSEKLPYFGAPRKVFGRSDWKEGVHNLMIEASVVILAVGPTESLAWEFSQLVKHHPPKKTVLFIDHSSLLGTINAYVTFVQNTDDFWLHEPPSLGESRFILFDSKWTPFRIPPYNAIEAMFGGKLTRLAAIGAMFGEKHTRLALDEEVDKIARHAGLC